MFKTATALTVALAASAAFGEVSVTSAPAGIAGYTTYTVTVTGDTLGFNAATATFTGSMNQVLDYGAYVFLNPTFDNLFPALGQGDSYFLFTQPNLLVSSSESATSLASSFAYDEAVAADFPLAQIVAADDVDEIILKLDLAYPGGTEILTVFNDNIVPTPATGSLLGLAGLAMLRRR